MVWQAGLLGSVQEESRQHKRGKQCRERLQGEQQKKTPRAIKLLPLSITSGGSPIASHSTTLMQLLSIWKGGVCPITVPAPCFHVSELTILFLRQLCGLCLMILLSHLFSGSVENHPPCDISSWSCTSLSTWGKRRKRIWITLPRSQRYAKQHGLTTGGRPKVTRGAQAPALQHTSVSFILQTAALKSVGYLLPCWLYELSITLHANNSFPHAVTGFSMN